MLPQAPRPVQRRLGRALGLFRFADVVGGALQNCRRVPRPHACSREGALDGRLGELLPGRRSYLENGLVQLVLDAAELAHLLANGCGDQLLQCSKELLVEWLEEVSGVGGKKDEVDLVLHGPLQGLESFVWRRIVEKKHGFKAGCDLRHSLLELPKDHVPHVAVHVAGLVEHEVRGARVVVPRGPFLFDKVGRLTNVEGKDEHFHDPLARRADERDVCGAVLLGRGRTAFDGRGLAVDEAVVRAAVGIEDQAGLIGIDDVGPRKLVTFHVSRELFDPALRVKLGLRCDPALLDVLGRDVRETRFPAVKEVVDPAAQRAVCEVRSQAARKGLEGGPRVGVLGERKGLEGGDEDLFFGNCKQVQAVRATMVGPHPLPDTLHRRPGE